VVVGLIGSDVNRAGARGWIQSETGLQADELFFVEADEGFEQVTLSILRKWSAENEDAAVLYAHGKGAYNISCVTADHRRVMTENVVGRWCEAVSALKSHDMVGSFWAGPEHEPQPPYTHFVGNFWWGNASYLAKLPEPATDSRHDAETWPGLGSPRAFEMNSSFSYPQLTAAALRGETYDYVH
jgi:hypothetical protein